MSGGVVYGSPVTSSNSNAAWLAKNADDTTVGKVTLANTDAPSGAQVDSAQKSINALDSFTGAGPNGVYNQLPVWTNNDVGSSTDPLKLRADLLTQKFNAGSGHFHTGAPGDGPLIPSTSVSAVPLHAAIIQATDIPSIAASATNVDVSSLMTGEIPSTGDTVKGWPVNAPYNKVILREADGSAITHGTGGNEVYGRLTESLGTWTITFYYIDNTGTEQPYTFVLTHTNVKWYSQILINPITDSGYTYDSQLFTPSTDATADIVDATPTQRGLVNTTTQSFGGAKTFEGVTVTQDFYGAWTDDSTSTGSNATLANPTSTAVRLTNVSLASIDMINDSTAGRIIIFSNETGNELTVHNDTGATPALRILTGQGSNFAWKNNATIIVMYDNTSARWKVVGGTAGGIVGKQETPAGTPNGVNTTFGPLTYVPLSSDSIAVYVDGILRPNTEWSYSSPNIVFNVGSIPSLGQSVYVVYLSNGSSTAPPSFTGTWRVEYHTISGGEATAKQFTMSYAPAVPSYVMADVIGGTAQVFGLDFTVSGSTFGWSGLALDGILSSGDVIRLSYQS